MLFHKATFGIQCLAPSDANTLARQMSVSNDGASALIRSVVVTAVASVHFLR